MGRSGLNELKEAYSIIGDVRGIGLMIGVELVEKNLSPAAEKCKMVIKNALEGGIILLPAGESVIRFVPPLIITREEIDRGMDIFEDALKEVEAVARKS